MSAAGVLIIDCEGGELHPDLRTYSNYRQAGPRRLRTCWVTPEIWLHVLKQGTLHTEIVANALPEDASLLRARYDSERRAFCLVLESESFDPVPPGDPIPEHPPVEFRVVR